MPGTDPNAAGNQRKNMMRAVEASLNAEGKAEADARTNSEMMKGYNRADERARKVVAEVQAVAHEIGRSPAQVALAWLRHRPVPAIPIVGARRLEQFRDNLACLEWKCAS